MLREIGGVLREYWDRLVASDPGLGRLISAAQAAGALASALAVEYAAARLLGASSMTLLFYLFMGGIVGMMGALALSNSDTDVWGKVRTAAFFPVAVGTGLTIGTLTHSYRALLLAVFVVMTFLAVFVRRFGIAFFFYGFMGWIGYLFAALLGAEFSMLPTLIGALVIGASWVLLLSLTVMRTNSSRALRRTVRSFQARVRTVAAVCADLTEVDVRDQRELRRWRMRLHRQQSRLVEAALMIEASSGAARAVPNAGTGEQLRAYILEAQLAIDALAGAAEDIAVHQPQFATRAGAIARLLSRREFRRADRAAQALQRAAGEDLQAETGRWWPHYRLAEAVNEFTILAERPPQLTASRARSADDGAGFQAAVGLMMGNLPGSAAIAREVSPRGPRWKLLDRLDMPTRQALQVGVAATLAIIAGYAVSDYRYYWALIAVFVTFTGSATRAESARKGIYRVLGTLLGLFVAIFLAHATAGNVWLVLVTIVGCMFCGFYMIRISYAIMIFFITIMVAQLYSVLHEFSNALLYLRLEETAIGAAIGIAVAMFFLPLSTGDTVRQARTAVLGTLAEVLSAIAERLGGPRTVATDQGADKANVDARDGSVSTEQKQPAEPEALARTLDDQVRILEVVATPFARPAMWGSSRRRVRYRLTRFAAIAAHVRTITVALRRHELTDEPAPAEICRSLAGFASRLASEGSYDGKQPLLQSQSALASERMNRIDERIRIRQPDASPPRHVAITRPLAHINDLLNEIAAVIPPGHATGGGGQSAGHESGTGVGRRGSAPLPPAHAGQ